MGRTGPSSTPLRVNCYGLKTQDFTSVPPYAFDAPTTVLGNWFDDGRLNLLGIDPKAGTYGLASPRDPFDATSLYKGEVSWSRTGIPAQYNAAGIGLAGESPRGVPFHFDNGRQSNHVCYRFTLLHALGARVQRY